MTEVPSQDVDRLVDNLGGKDPVQRREARAALMRIGSAAVPRLLDALRSPQQHLRWEAAKTLGEIADPAAAEGLVHALGDNDNDVRWVVAEALIALGRDTVRPLLTMLTQADPVHRLYQGAHHVLHDLAQRPDLAFLLESVLKAFQEPEPGVSVPVAAAEALQEAANHASD